MTAAAKLSAQVIRRIGIVAFLHTGPTTIMTQRK
jgi:hypothetical protein